jgi:myo-inositol-1(or 4)-monophosphatase
MTNPAPAELLELVRTIAQEAGALAALRRSEGVEVAATKSSAVDVVTHADRETEVFIRAAIAKARPNDGFFGEESAGTLGTSGLTWVVDPIDGTVNYLYGIPQYAVSIAVVEGEADPHSWTALAGVVFNPASGEIFSASLGGGAYLGDKKLAVNRNVPLGQALVSTGFSYEADVRVKQAKVILGFIASVRDIRRGGSAALDLCSVAAGRVDVYAERGLNPWDHAAGALIAAEAGATVSGFGERAGSIDFLIAGDAPLVAELKPTLEALYREADLYQG